MKKTNSYVLWSGGMDSTYLIQRLLDSNPNQSVTAGYVELENNVEKVKMELAATEKLLKIFDKLYPGRVKFLGVVYRAKVCHFSDSIPLQQMPIWMSALMSYTPPEADEICIGYVMNDCAISYLEEFKIILNAYRKHFVPNLPKIRFPLTKLNKDQIYFSINNELRDHVVWCEMPTITLTEFKPCGKCVPCQHSPIHERRSREILAASNFVETLNPTVVDSLEKEVKELL